MPGLAPAALPDRRARWSGPARTAAIRTSPASPTPELRGVLELTANKAIKEASELTDEHAVSLPVDELTDKIIAKHDVEVPTLHSAARYFEEGGSRTGIELQTRFHGTAGLFHNRPSRFSLGGGPDGQVVGSDVVVTLGPAAGADARADLWTEQVSNYLGYVAHDVDVWRPGLRDQVRGWVARRQAEAENHQEDLRSLGIPIRRRGDAPPVFREPAIVKRERPAAPPSGAGSTATGEPALSDAYFEHILFVIRAAGKAMERSPKTYEGWGEEDRRQVMILMLNTHYAGMVHAEAFNSDGKTDILIREENKNVFIGECKLYDGPKTVTETLKQIFGYTTWRDVKLAIIFFVDRKNAAEAIKRIKDTVEGNAQFRALLP